MKTLEDLFLEELADVYDAENRLVKALSKLAKTASSEDLKAAFEKHQVQTVVHIDRLNRVFSSFNRKPKGKKCEAMVGLLKEGDEIAEENRHEPTLDAALISAAQKVEHYEIASYGCLREWAQLLGNNSAAELLGKTLGEERNTDEALTELARADSNADAEGDGPSESNGGTSLRRRKSSRTKVVSRR